MYGNECGLGPAPQSPPGPDFDVSKKSVNWKTGYDVCFNAAEMTGNALWGNLMSCTCHKLAVFSWAIWGGEERKGHKVILSPFHLKCPSRTEHVNFVMAVGTDCWEMWCFLKGVGDVLFCMTKSVFFCFKPFHHVLLTEIPRYIFFFLERWQNFLHDA